MHLVTPENINIVSSISMNIVLITSRASFLIENLNQYAVFHFFLLPAYFLLLFLAWTLTLTSTSLASEHTCQNYYSGSNNS